jgi:hypothetical protein
MTRRTLAVALAAALMAGGCAEDESGPGAAQAPGGYQATSDVRSHAAIGDDIAAVRGALDAGTPDFAAAARLWSQGANSRKGDGSMRTLAGFVEEHPVGKSVADALAGTGAAAALDDAQRSQWVDKGIVVALEAKVLDELDAAIEKARAGDTDPAEGAPHNVDEAWAFYDASGEGLAATAEKRAADFGLDGQLSQPVLAALADAQLAATEGDADALRAAREAARGAMNRIFALAVTKYAKVGADDPVARAEGLAFSWGLHGDLPAAALRSLQRAFTTTPRATSVRRTLNASLPQLGFDEPVPVYEG